jgi:hypothetical protein
MRVYQSGSLDKPRVTIHVTHRELERFISALGMELHEEYGQPGIPLTRKLHEQLEKFWNTYLEVPMRQ